MLSNLKNKDFEKSKIYYNFYQNICRQIIEKIKNEKLSIAINLFFDPNTYKEITKKYGINHTNIEAILYGYRYCLNELSNYDESAIYCSLYDRDNISYLSEKIYPAHNSVKNKNKAGKLSPISYGLLNYIFYSHLFFARTVTNLKKFDKYLNEGKNWGETLKECWNLLEKRLSENGINSIDIFMDFTFKNVFNKLHNKECINNYDDDELNDFEGVLEEIIQEKIESMKNEIEKYKTLNQDNSNSFINTLKENYESQNQQKIFPFSENLYYSDYLNEKYIENYINYISEKISNKNKNKNSKSNKYPVINKYPVLNKYLNFIKINTENNIKDDYSLDNLNKFNDALNLFYEKYSDKITREYAEAKLLIDDEIYQNKEDKKLIDDFIKYYNKLKIKDNNGNIIKLKSSNNHLSDFFIDNNNEIGKTYKNIYKKFIMKQNEELETLLDIKITAGKLDDVCKNKINIQQIKEDEIFAFNEPEKSLFIKIVFNSSYRKIIDENNYKKYSQYEINLDSIERDMTNSILKKKKLLTENISEFCYK